MSLEIKFTRNLEINFLYKNNFTKKRQNLAACHFYCKQGVELLLYGETVN